MPATTSDALAIVSRTVSIAPLVLLSAVDHYDRMAKGSRRRVVGVLLGQNEGNHVRVTNCFAVPFMEDDASAANKDDTSPKAPSPVWYLDHDYVNQMRDMFKKVNAKEKLIGWYHSGPKLRASDMAINELFKRYTPNPLLVIIDVQPKDVGIPTDAYFAVEEIRDDGTGAAYTFVHTPSIVEAEEAEEIGVEHLLRDIRDVAVGTLSSRLTSQVKSLQSLHSRLNDIGVYLDKVLKDELPSNHAILGTLQDIFNLLPNLSTPKLAAAASQAATQTAMAQSSLMPDSASGNANSNSMVDNSELARAMAIKNNDQLMMIFLSSLIRAITAFHDLISNKIENVRHQEEKEREAEAEAKKESEAKANKEKEGEKEKEKAKKEEQEKEKEKGQAKSEENKDAEMKD